MTQASDRMKQSVRSLANLAILLAISGCNVGCSKDAVSTICSPSGTTDVVVFNRICGATAGFNTQVSIVSSGAARVGAGDTLLVQRELGQPLLEAGRGPPPTDARQLKSNWKGSRAIS